MKGSIRIAVIAMAVLALCAAGTGFAQTTKTELRTVTVLGVSGNTVQFTNEQGETKEYTVAPTQKFMMDGKEIGLADIKPGMKLTAVVETTTTPVAVKTTTIKNGRVLAVAGDTLVVQEANGNHKYTIPHDYKFLVNGQPMTLADLRPGMELTATIVSKETKNVTERELKTVYAKGAAPAPAPKAAAAPAPPPPAAEAAPAPAAAEAAPAKKKLPKTASPVPLAGLAGGLSLLAGLGLRLRRAR
ncbi:MAG: hypothetical protein ACM3JH_09950 [Acidithiobacillales bacterium]